MKENKTHIACFAKKSIGVMSVRHFRQWNKERSFSSKINCVLIVGEQGTGETNVVVVPVLNVDRNAIPACVTRRNQLQSLCYMVSGTVTYDSTYDSTFVEEKSLPAIVPVKIGEETLWAFLDTGSGRNFISRNAAKKLKLTPVHHESREIVTLNGISKQSMPIYQVSINSLDGTVQEEIQVSGSKMCDFTTVRRSDISQLKQKFCHAKDKMFYMVRSGNYPIHLILGDKTYSRIRTEQVLKGNEGDPVVEETTFGWLIHGGDDYSSDQCMFVRETNECEQLYSLDVLGVEDRSEKDQMEVLTDFRESVTRQEDCRYEVSIPWIPGARLYGTNEQPSRIRLANVNKKLCKDRSLKVEYEKIVKDQLANGIVEKAPEKPAGKRTYYMPHKPVIRENATTTKIRMFFYASAKPAPLANSINECMFTGPSLQPLLWDILSRARMIPNLLLADIQKDFLQIGVKETDRDAFRFLFEIDGRRNISGLQDYHSASKPVPFCLEQRWDTTLSNSRQDLRKL